MQLTKNFNIKEFRCKNAAKTMVPVEFLANISILAKNLQVLRDHIAASGHTRQIHINSGYRTPAHNAIIGGRPNSYHLKAMAADIVVEGFEPKEVRRIILTLIAKGAMKAGGCKDYNSFTHYDIRGYNATW